MAGRGTIRPSSPGCGRPRRGRRFFDGTYYQLVDSPRCPSPPSGRSPPVILGGIGTRRTPRLAARYADEFNMAFQGLLTTEVAFGRVRDVCTEAGRDPSSMRFSAAKTVCCGRDDAEVARRAAAIGRLLEDMRANGELAGRRRRSSTPSAATPAPGPTRSTCRSSTSATWSTWNCSPPRSCRRSERGPVPASAVPASAVLGSAVRPAVPGARQQQGPGAVVKSEPTRFGSDHLSQPSGPNVPVSAITVPAD